MGTIDTMVMILAVWTALSVALVAAWSSLANRQRLAFVVREPRSHVHVVEHLAPVVSLDSRRR